MSLVVEQVCELWYVRHHQWRF